MRCSIEGCAKRAWARGWCSTHYSRWRLHGTTALPTASERFWAKVDKSAGPEGCWPWGGAMQRNGYGAFATTEPSTGDKKQGTAHRVAYGDVVGPVSDDLVVDHLCRNRACVNPAHLEPVTQQENVIRGESPGGRAARTNRCKRGHEFTPENTIVDPGKFGRGCKACVPIRARKRQGASA